MTDFLFSKPDWLSGVMSVLDLFGLSQGYDSSLNPEIADRFALNSDINVLKKDFDVAYSQVRSEYGF